MNVRVNIIRIFGLNSNSQVESTTLSRTQNPSATVTDVCRCQQPAPAAGYCAEAQTQHRRRPAGRGLDGEDEKSRLCPGFRDGPWRIQSWLFLNARPLTPLHPLSKLQAPPPRSGVLLAQKDPCQDPASQCHTHVFKLDIKSSRWRRRLCYTGLGVDFMS
jgi:hypothetical protein